MAFLLLSVSALSYNTNYHYLHFSTLTDTLHIHYEAKLGGYAYWLCLLLTAGPTYDKGTEEQGLKNEVQILSAKVADTSICLWENT